MTIELGIVNVSPVDGQDVPAGVIGRSEHEAVVRGSGSVLDVRGDTLIGVYVGMHLDPAFLPACLWMPSHTLEDEVGEERDGRRINDLKP